MYNYEEQARSANRPDPSFQNNINQPPASVPSEVSKPAAVTQWPVSRPVGILPPNYRTERSKNNHMTPLIESEQYQRTVRTNSTNQHNIIRPQPRTMPIDCQAGYSPYAYYPTRSAPHYVTPENVSKRQLQFTAGDPRYINGSQETLQKTTTDGRIASYPRYTTEMVTSAQQNSVPSLQERIANHHIPFHDPQTKDTSHLNCTTCQTSSCAHIQRQTACAYGPSISTLQQSSGTWPGSHSQSDMWAMREEQRQMLPIEGIDMSVGNPYAMQYFERKNNDSGNTDDSYKKQHAESYQIQKQQINKLKKLQSSINQHSRPVEWTHEGHGSSGIIQPYPLGRYSDPNQRGQISRTIPSHLSLPMHSSMSSDNYKLPDNLNYINSNSHLHSRLTTSYPPTNQPQMTKGTSYFSHPHANYAAPVSSHHNMNSESASNQSFSKPSFSVSMSSYPNPPLNSCNERYENINYGQTMQVVDNSAGNKGGVPYQQDLHQAYKPPAPNYFDPKSVSTLEIPSSHMAYSNAMYRKSVMESVRASRHKLHPSYGMIPSSGANVPGTRLIQNFPTNYQHEAPFVEMTLLDDCELARKRRKQDEVHVIHSVNREPAENGSEKKRPADELRKFYENWDAEEVDETAEATVAATVETRKPQEMMVLDCTNLQQDNLMLRNEEMCSETVVQAYKLESQGENSYTSVIKPLKERQKTSTKVINPLRNFRKPAFATSEPENLLTALHADNREIKEINLVGNLETMSFLNESVGLSTQENGAGVSVESIEVTSKPTPVDSEPVATSALKDSHLNTESIISMQDLHDISLVLSGTPSDSEKCLGSSKPTSDVLATSAMIQDSLSNNQSQNSPLNESNQKETTMKDAQLLSQSHWDPLSTVSLQNAPNTSHSQHLSTSSLTTDDSGIETDNVISIPDVDDNSKLNDDLFVANLIPVEHFKITKKKVKANKSTKKPLDSVIKYVSSEMQKNLQKVISVEPANNPLAYVKTSESLSAVDLSCKSSKSNEEPLNKPNQLQNHQEVIQEVQLADSTTVGLSHLLGDQPADGESKDVATHDSSVLTTAQKPHEDSPLEFASLCDTHGNNKDAVPVADEENANLKSLQLQLRAQDLQSAARLEFTDSDSTPVAVEAENPCPKFSASPIPSDLHNAERYSLPKPEILHCPRQLQPSPGKPSSPERGRSPSPESLCSLERNGFPALGNSHSPEHIQSPAMREWGSPEHNVPPAPENLGSPEHSQLPAPANSRSPECLQAAAPGGWSPERNESPAQENQCSLEHLQSSQPQSVCSPEKLQSSPPRSPCSPENCHSLPPRSMCNPENLLSSQPQSVCSPEKLQSSPPRSPCSPENCHSSPPRSICNPENLLSSQPQSVCSPEKLQYSPPRSPCSPENCHFSPPKDMCSPENLLSPPPRDKCTPENVQSSPPRDMCSPENVLSPPLRSICSPKNLQLPKPGSCNSPDSYRSLTPEISCCSEYCKSPTPLKTCSPECRQSPVPGSCSPDPNESPTPKSLGIPEQLKSPAQEDWNSPEGYRSPSLETFGRPENLKTPSPHRNESPAPQHLGSTEKLESLPPATVCSQESHESPALANTHSPDPPQFQTPAGWSSPECNGSPASGSISSPGYSGSPRALNLNDDIETSISQSDQCVQEETDVKSPYQTDETEENDKNLLPTHERLESSADYRETVKIPNEDDCRETIEDNDQEQTDELLFAKEDKIAESPKDVNEEVEMDINLGNDSSYRDGEICDVEKDLDLAIEGPGEKIDDQEPIGGHYEESPDSIDLLSGGSVSTTVENDEVVVGGEDYIVESTTKSEDEINEPECLIDNTAELLKEEQNTENLANLAVLQIEEETYLVTDQETQEEGLKSDVSEKSCEVPVEEDDSDQLENSELTEEHLEFVNEEYDETEEELSAALNEDGRMDYIKEKEIENEEDTSDGLQDKVDMKQEDASSEREESFVESLKMVEEEEEAKTDVRMEEVDEIDAAETIAMNGKDLFTSDKLLEENHEEFSVCDEDVEEDVEDTTFSANADDPGQDLNDFQDEEIDNSETSLLTETKSSLLNVENNLLEELASNRAEQEDSLPIEEIVLREDFDEHEATLASINHVDNQNGLRHKREDCPSDEFFTPTAEFSSPSSDSEDAVDGVNREETDSPTEFNQHMEEFEKVGEMHVPDNAIEDSTNILQSTGLETEPEICSKHSAVEEKSPETLIVSKHEPLNYITDSEAISGSCKDPSAKLGLARNEKEQDVGIVSKVSKSWSEWKKSRKNLDLQKSRNHIQLDPRLHRRSSPKAALDEELKRDLELHASQTDSARVSNKNPDVNPRSNFLDSISAAFKNLDPLPLGEDLVSEIMNDFNEPETVAASPKSVLLIACPDSEMPALEIGAIVSPVNSESLEMPCLEAMSDPFEEPSSPNPSPVVKSVSVTSSPERCINMEEDRVPISETFSTDEPLQNWPYLEEEVFSETPRNQSPVIETTCSGQAYSPAPSYTTDSDTPSSKDLTNVPCERNIYDKPLNVLADTSSPFPQLKCSLSWDKIFNLSKTNRKNLRDIGIKSTGPHHKKILLSNLPDFCKKINEKKDKKRSSLQERDDEFDLELGPATIEVRLKPNGNRRQWNVVDGIKTENVPEMSLREENNNIAESGNQTRNVKSPIVVVKRIILKRRAEEMNDSIPNEVSRAQGPSCLTTPPESDDGSTGQKALPKVVIKRTRHGHSKYQSFLRLSEGDGSRWQPTVQIERNQLLENMVKRHVFFTHIPRGNCDKENEQVPLPTPDQFLREAPTVKTPFTNLLGIEQDEKITETNGLRNSKFKGRKHSKVTKEKATSKSILRRMLSSSKSNTGSSSTVYNLFKPPNTDQEDTQEKEVVKHSGRRHSDVCSGSDPQIPERRQRGCSTNELTMPVAGQGVETSVNTKPRPRGRPRKDCSERRKPVTVAVEAVEVAQPAEEKISAPDPEIFTCLACKFVFEEEAEMTAHVQTHSYHCQKCNVAFIAETDFESHLLAEHPDTKQLHHCLLCKLCFACAEEHAAHVAGMAHSRLELTQRWTIQTLFALFTGAPCAQIAPLTDVEAAEMSSLAETVPGAINYYHQPTPLQLAVQDLLSRGVRSPGSETGTSGSTKKTIGEN